MSTKTEKYRNLAETTLASGYTAGDPTISVTAAGDFPTDGDFSIALDNASNTLLRVSAVSGTTFTVTAEENDANASAGAAVVLIATRLVGERWLQGPLTGEARSPYGSDGASFVGPFQFPVTALSQSSWTWMNQGGAAYSESAGLVYVTCTTATGTNGRGRHKSISGTTSWTMGVMPGLWGVAAAGIRLMSHGLLLRESGTNKFTIFAVSNFTFSTGGGGNTLIHANYTNNTTFGAVITERAINFVPPYNFLKITDSGGNLTFYHSVDKVNYYQFAQVGRTSHMAGGPDQVGWFLTNQASAGGLDFWSTIFSWEES